MEGDADMRELVWLPVSAGVPKRTVVSTTKQT